VRSEAASGGGDLDLGSKRKQGREESEATGNNTVGSSELDLVAEEDVESGGERGGRETAQP
jgi:hypothetical protein